MVHPFRQAPAGGLDWWAIYLMCPSNPRDDIWRSACLAQDGFVPAGVCDLSRGDITALFAARHGQPRGIPTAPTANLWHGLALQKIVVMAAEAHLDWVARLPAAQRDWVVAGKVSTPTERELYWQAYAYLLGHEQSADAFPALFDLAQVLTRVGVAPAIAAKVHVVDAGYRLHFGSHRPLG